MTVYIIFNRILYSQWSLRRTSWPWILCTFAKFTFFPFSKKLPRIVKVAHPVFKIVDWHAVVSLALEAWGLASMVEPDRGTECTVGPQPGLALRVNKAFKPLHHVKVTAQREVAHITHMHETQLRYMLIEINTRQLNSYVRIPRTPRCPDRKKSQQVPSPSPSRKAKTPSSRLTQPWSLLLLMMTKV